MIVSARQKKAPTIHQRKRVGQHHKQGKHYTKVYWPYSLMALVVALGLLLGNWHPTTKNGVLAYATNVSEVGLLDSTNVERQSNGAATLKTNDKLIDAAQNKANDMVARNYWSHNTPDNKAPWEFVQEAGYVYQIAGENLAYGFDSSKDVITAWMNSAAHRENLLDKNYTEVGFGFANGKDYNGAGPETVVVAMYATPYSGEALALTANNNQGAAGYNSNNGASEPKTLAVSHLQNVTKISSAWTILAAGLLGGAAVMFVTLKHLFILKRAIVKGESFVHSHPLLDVTLVIFVMTIYVSTRTTGLIR